MNEQLYRKLYSLDMFQGQQQDSAPIDAEVVSTDEDVEPIVMDDFWESIELLASARDQLALSRSHVREAIELAEEITEFLDQFIVDADSADEL